MKNYEKNFDIFIENTHYKNVKTDLTENKNINNIDYSKINCSTKDLLKEKDKKIEILQEQMIKLQKKLEQQTPNNNYKNSDTNNNNTNNLNYISSNCNTSTNFPLKSEIKKLWEEIALVSLLDNFIDYENQPEIIFHLVSEIVLITDKLISELCFDIYQKVSQSLNIINDKKIINDIEKTSRPLIKEHLNKTFAVTNNQQFIDKFVNLFNNSIKKIFIEKDSILEKLENVVETSDFKVMIKKIKDILLFTKFNDQQLFFNIEKDFNKRIVEKIKIKNNIEKKKYLIINDNSKEQVEGIVILKPPVLKSGFPLNNDFKTIIMLYEKEANSKSYKNLKSLKEINKKNENKGKVNKILGMKIKKIIPSHKSIYSNKQIKKDEYSNNYNRNNNSNKIIKESKSKDEYSEEIINILLPKDQRNSYHKILKKNDIQKKINFNKKTNINLNKENNFIDDEEGENNIQEINYKSIYKYNENLSRDAIINDKRNTSSSKKNHSQLTDQILKNNSSKNLNEYIHNNLLSNNSSLKKYKSDQKDLPNMALGQNHFVTYNNNEIKSVISLNNNTESNENDDNDNDNEENNEKEIIFHNNTEKGVFTVSGKERKNNLNNIDFEEENIKNKRQRNTSNNENIDILNEIYLNKNEKKIILNNKIKEMNYNQFKENLYSKNSLTKLNKKNILKKIQNNNKNRNYKKKDNQKSPNNDNYKKKMEYYYRLNNAYENTDINNNQDNTKLNIMDIDIYKSLFYSKEENSNLYIKNDNKDINNNLYEQVILFKKNKTDKIISNKMNVNKNVKKEFKIIPIIQIKNQLNQINSNDALNQNQNIDFKNKIKGNIQHRIKNKNKPNNNNVSDIYIKNLRNNKNLNNFIMDNNSVGNLYSKKLITIENNKNLNSNNYNEFKKEKKRIIISPNKYKSNDLHRNQNIHNNMSKEKNIIKKINNQGKRNNNLLVNNFYDDYNNLNNTGYKIKNVNINYFNIMQPNKLYINQNSTRSKSRPNDCERNKIMINYGYYNKNIMDSSNQNQNDSNSKNINYNNDKIINNNFFIKRINNIKKKTSSHENSNRINIKSNMNNFQNKQNNKINNIKNYNYKINFIQNNSYNINKSPINNNSDLTNNEKMKEQINNKKRVLIKIKGHRHNNISGLNEDLYHNESNDKNYINNKRDKNSLTLGNNKNQSSNNTSRKKNKCHILNNKHFSYIKIPKKIKNKDIRPISNVIRYIEKNDNNFSPNSEYSNQINNYEFNNDSNFLRGSYILIDKERNSNINNDNIIPNYNNYENNINNNRNIYDINNKNNFCFNGMTAYNYNSFRKNNKII